MTEVGPIAVTAEGLPVPPALPDSLAWSTLNPEPVYGMVIDNPVKDYGDENMNAAGPVGMSWVLLTVGLLFCAVGLKFHNNVKYLKALIGNLTDVKVRQNVFDDTVKETSFLLLLNFLWICCAGILLWRIIVLDGGLRGLENGGNYAEAIGIGISTGMAGVYLGALMAAYWVIGRVFTDTVRTRIWLKGASASTALETLPLLPLSVLTICYEPWSGVILPIAGGVFILGKIIFIYKGFRIFFNQMSSWMLFLYYLCSIEIVPLVLTYLVTIQVCGRML